MINKIKVSLCLIAFLFSSLNAHATDDSERAPDPADVTRVLTSVRVFMGVNSDDNNIAGDIELKLAGSFNKDNNFLTMLEVSGAEKESDPFEDGFDLREIRGRWFQVFGTGNDVMPKVGYSLDVIDRSNDDSELVDNIYAIGGVAKVPVLSNYVMYPNIALVQANLKDEYKKVISGSDDGQGIQLNVFNSVYLSKKGTYLMIIPQYTYLDFDSFKTQDLLVESRFGTPLTDDRSFWFEASYKETFSDIDSDTPAVSDVSFEARDDKRQFRVGVRYFF
ncbi:hypothetical protein [Photobacterium alginatilyticum]|uniref:Porin n=1 Tax=Photobacterium alginatilyticum TaxID=1775171 RepID=A0ABW9YC18_9GAMM|nr:hypothetical protein [Photobacterium alginatilyticum]NBI51227.1 hypothetical protein [Photobacterium alginatilyticum]